MLSLANIRPGGRYLAVDDASGVVVAGIIERLGGLLLFFLTCRNAHSTAGDGRVITICDTESPPAYPVMVTMNFPPGHVKPVLSSLNWATSEEDYTPSTPLKFTE